MVINMKTKQPTDISVLAAMGKQINKYKAIQQKEYTTLVETLTNGLFEELHRRLADHLKKKGELPFRSTIEIPNGYDHILQNKLCFDPELSGINTKEIYQSQIDIMKEMGFRLEIIPHLRGILVTVR